jgi:hypothetical protein
MFRAIENGLSETEIKEWLGRSTSIPLANFKSFNLTSEKDAPKSVFSCEAESRRYGSKAGKRIFLPLNVINRYENIPPKKEKRMFPVVISEGFIEIDTITLYLPPGYIIESNSRQDVVMNTDFANYEMKIVKGSGALMVIRKLELHRMELPPEKYGEYRDFFKQVVKADNLKAVLVKAKV